MNVGIVGLGYWGPNLVRNLVAQKDVANVFCCDLNQHQLKSIRHKFPSVQVTDSYKDLLSNPSIEGICIATPVSLHYKLASEALQAGKNVLVEKPMTDSVKDAEALVELAEQKKLVLMVDHTFIYTGSVKKIKELIESNPGNCYLYFNITGNGTKKIYKSKEFKVNPTSELISNLKKLVGEHNLNIN